MKRKTTNLLFAIVTPALLGLRYVLSPINELVLKPLSFRLAKRDQKKFEREIQLKIPFLFSEYSSRFLPERADLRAVTATIDVGTFLLSFNRWRNEISGYIRAKDADLGVTLSEFLDAINAPFYLRGKSDSLETWDEIMKPILPHLVEICSSGQFSERKEFLRELKRRIEKSV
jgi:hypothetical protein